jgi:hypothetical protein
MAGKTNRFDANHAGTGPRKPRRALVVPGLWVNGMALWPLILLSRPGPSARLLNHERIHLRQQLELLIGPFYLWYLAEYLVRRWQLGTHEAAYRAISFEREAYAHDTDPGYLRRRRFWAFLKYIRPRNTPAARGVADVPNES